MYLKTHGHNLKLISRKSYRVVGEINLLFALDPGFKANHWFSFIRKERSSCSQKNLLEKMPKVLQAILLTVSRLYRPGDHFSKRCRRDRSRNWRPDRDCGGG